MRLSPGDSIARAAIRAKGDPIILTAGAYTGGTIMGLRFPLRIEAEGIVIISGRELKIEDCAAVELADFECHQSPTHGVRVIKCESLLADGLRFQSCGSNGLTTANTPNVTVSNCESHESADGHGFYLSQSGDHLLIIGCVANGNARAGIQVNAVEPRPKRRDPKRDGISNDVRIISNFLRGNQAIYGGAGVNLAACRTVEIRGNHIWDHWGRHGIALFDDDAGAEYACRDVTIEGNAFSFAPGVKAQACVSIGKGCRALTVGRNEWAADVTPVAG